MGDYCKCGHGRKTHDERTGMTRGEEEARRKAGLVKPPSVRQAFLTVPAPGSPT